MHRWFKPVPNQPPDGDAMAVWLTSSEVVREDGVVLSWSHPDHPGHPYPEAAALWLARAAWLVGRGVGPSGAQVQAVRDRLAGDLRASDGIGRDGRVYLFDTALAIHALASISEAYPDLISSEAVDPASYRGTVLRFLDADLPSLGSGDERSCRWSERWAPHLYRAASFLARTAARLGDEGWRDAALEVRRRATREAPADYCHARAYAVEGEVIWRALGEAPGQLDPAAEALAFVRLQRDDGGLPAYMDGSGPHRADATAQAIRLWALVDLPAHGESISRALDFLACLQAPSGGIFYEAGSADVNTWASVFVDQALCWTRSGADPLDLL
jgi:hypothetical protein